ncbi:hepcidin-1 [Hypanus sabinus]|uniref:hepcidin-1 n=1 Tax=Hypanus sabinus TaxID=79690 RepID=UPI0028C41900|nr:hepcidin-1 [Hypanus sabinus]
MMKSFQSKLLLVSLVLMTIVCLSECRSLLTVDQQHTSLTAENDMDADSVDTVLLRQKRMSHLSVCVYCCNCCKTRRTKKTCGVCCRL